MATVTEGMVVDRVDRDDQPIGLIHRDEVFIKHARSRRPRSHFQLARRTLGSAAGEYSRSHPGYWGSSVAAYLFAGESYQAAAVRRLAEELGVHGVALSYIGKTSMTDEGSEKFIGVFAATSDGRFHFDRNQIQKLEFLQRNVIHQLQLSGERTFTPTFLKVLSFYESKL